MNINRFWRDVLSQNREALASYFREDAVIRWHCTNEQFTVTEYVRANCDYPGNWDGRIERVETLGSAVLTVVHIYPVDRSASFHVVSFIVLSGDKICEMDEYWADDGEAPQWRRAMHIGRPIR
ncbi:MAG: nuclear transport factor 2 family protein [Ruminococcaceae bacterium]|nr:nuclear transport factor 2 family protein [Oscillospiraceae bacterium]